MPDQSLSKKLPLFVSKMPWPEAVPNRNMLQLKLPSRDEIVATMADQPALHGTELGSPLMSNSAARSDRELSQPGHSWSEVPENIVPSAVNAATGLWDMVTHPQRTAETMVDAAQGGVDRIVPEEFTNFMDSYVSPRSPETRERQRQVSGAVGQALKDRYWGFDNLKRAMITDPVGSALDVAGIAAGAAGLIRGPLAIGSRARLAESPAAALNAGRPATKELGQTIAADANRNKIYAPPTKPQRPFEADYTKGVQADAVDETGNLLVDRHNRPFNPGDMIFGRRTLGGDDVRANHKEFRKIGKRLMGKPIKVVPRGHIDGNSGRVQFNPATNEPHNIFLADDLDMTKSRSKHISDHEISHLMDLKTGRQPVPPEIWGELEPVYSALATGKENLPSLTRPANRGYSGPNIRDELVSEGFRAAFNDPNYMKTAAPKAYDWLAGRLADHPHLGLRLNSLGAATAAALGAMGEQNESEASEVPGSEARRPVFPGQSIPFGLPGEVAEADAYGLSKLTKALSQRGNRSAPKNAKFRGLVRALADLEARQKPRLHGGPRL